MSSRPGDVEKEVGPRELDVCSRNRKARVRYHHDASHVENKVGPRELDVEDLLDEEIVKICSSVVCPQLCIRSEAPELAVT